MDYEKKYKEALEWARKVMQGKVGFVLDEVLEKFPELKENEDERIRKALLALVEWSKSYSASGITVNEAKEMISWLEKQAEHANFRNKIQIGDKVTRNKAGVLVNLSQLNRVAKIDEKQGEPVEMNPTEFDTRLQVLIGKFNSLPKEELIGSLSFWMNVVQNNGTYKSDEKQGDSIEEPNFFDDFRKTDSEIEPKFKVGDWIVTPKNKVLQITSIEGTSYKFNNESHYWEICYCDEQCRLWTIQDAKDSDVLANSNISVFIYAEVLYNKPYAYCGVDKFGVFKDNCRKYDWSNSVDNIHPATKEQRNLLFQKMHEAGYEWDAEKKELKKTGNEIEIPFSAKDSEFLGANYCIPEGFHAEIKGNRVFIKKGEQKPTWSEEDEKMIRSICCYLNEFGNWLSDKNDEKSQSIYKACDWLKSLRPQNRWKPSDEQMKALDIAIRCGIHLGIWEEEVLKSLKEQLFKLKKLKGE